MHVASPRTDGDGIQMLWVVSWVFSIQSVFDHLGDCGTVDGDARSLESFRVGDPRAVGICVIPKGLVVNSSSRMR